MKNNELTELQNQILDFLINKSDSPICSAKQIGELFDTTSQKASGALRSLEHRGLIAGQTLGGDRFSVKAYFLPDLMEKFRQFERENNDSL